MRLVRHPLVARDLIGIVEHIVAVTGGDHDAATRRLDEVDALLARIFESPSSGARLSAPLEGWLVRHGGRDNRLTIVFRPDLDRNTIFVALVAFGGQDWMAMSGARASASEHGG